MTVGKKKIDALQKEGTVKSLTTAAKHLYNLLQKNRDDGNGYRFVLPAILLRLNRDQECYDFIK